MTYDYSGGWANVTGHQSAIYANSSDPTLSLGFWGDRSMSAYVQAGFPRSKLLIGAAFYGRSFAQVNNANNGMFQPFSGVPRGVSCFHLHSIFLLPLSVH